MPDSIIARVERVTARKPYSEQSIEVSFPGDLLYRIDVPDGVEEVNGKRVFTREGIRHIVKELTVVLYVETEETDY